MTAALWEWSTSRDAQGGSVGVSMTRYGAMEALAKALVGGSQPREGQVVPVILAQPLHQAAYYVRGYPQHIALYEGGVIRWR